MGDGSRFDRERRTMRAMLDVYCKGRHAAGRGGLCPGCAEVLAYAEARLDKCLFPDTKPTCASCPVHCYRPAMRERVKEIMRSAGPRLIYRHPWLAFRHWLDSRRQPPAVSDRKRPAAPTSGDSGAAGTSAGR